MVLVALTVGVVLVAGRKSGEHPQNTTNPAADTYGLPSPVVRPLPGTKTLFEYAGEGTKTVDAGAPRVSGGRELALNVVCSGSGSVSVGPVTLGCNGPFATAADGLSTSALRIVARPRTKWRIAFTDQPLSGTNGALANPPDPNLTVADSPAILVRVSGSGSRPIAIPKPAGRPVSAVRIALTCSGAGVTLASAVSGIDGRYAKSCFRGWSYEFDTDSVQLPAAFVVRAAPATTWKLVVIRL